MAENLEPINIDINMRQNVSEESDRASQSMDSLASRSNAALSAMEKDTTRQIDIIKQMTYVIDELQKQMSVHPELFTDDQVGRLDTMRQTLTDTQSRLESYIETYTSMADAVNQGADITDLMNERTQDLSETEESLRDTMTEILDTQSEVNDIMEENSDATDENTESTEGNTVANKLMSTAIREICSALGIENTAILNTIGNTRTLTGVKGLWTNATRLLNTQLGISIGLSRALVATGIGLVIAAIAAAVYAYNKWKEGQDEVNRGLEDNRKLNESAAASASKLTAIFNKMQQEYNTLGDNLQAKKKYIDDNQKSFDQLGISVQTVNEADNLFITNAENFRNAIMIRAQATAAMELASEKYKQAMQKMHDADVREQDPGIWEKIWNSNKFVYRNGQNVLRNSGAVDAADEERKEAEKIMKEAGDLITKNISLTNDYTNAVKEAGIAQDEVITEGTKAFYEQQKKRAAERMAVLKDTDKDSTEWKQAVKDFNNANDKLKLWDISGQNKSSDSANKKAAKEQEKNEKAAKKANEDLAKKAIDYQTRIDAARIAAMQEGANKQRATIEANYTKEKSLIEQELRELEELEKKTGKPATGQRNQLTQLDAAVTAEYEAKIAALNEASEKAIREIFDEVNQKFSSELDNNLAQITKYYDEQIKKAKEAGATIAQINLLTSAKQKETILAGLDAKQKEIDFDTEIALRREEMSGKFYLLEADRQLALLKIHREATKKTLNNLKEQYKNSPTTELARQIETATVALEGFGKEEKNLKLQKFRQAADYIAEAAGMLNSLFQDDGAFSNETMAQITSTVGSIAQGFASGGIIGGAMAAAGEAINLVNAAAAAEKRHQEALKVLQQAKIAMQREYLQLLLEEQLQYKNGTSIFGTDTIGKVVNAIDVYRKSIKAYKEELQGDFTPNEAYEKGLEKQAGKGGIMSGYFDKKLNEYRKQLELYNKGTAALYDAEIVTGHKKTGLFGWGKGKDTYSKILDVYPDVIDAEGKLNKERVQSILDTRKMNDETRNLLQTLLDLEEQAESAQEEMRSLLESTFGSLGDSLATAIVDAFSSGEDALMNFKDNVTDVLNGFAKQMIYSQFLSKIFTGLQGDIEDAYNQLADGAITEQDLSSKVTDLLGDFFGGLGGTVDQANQFLEQFWKNAEAAGFDRPESERTGASKGIATASQDSINELNGGVYAIRQSVNDIRNLEKESVAVQKTQQASLDRIADGVEASKEHLREIKNGINEITNTGVKIKDR